MGSTAPSLQRAAWSPSSLWVATACVAAAGLGAAAALDVETAVALAVAFVLAALIALHPPVMLAALVATVFVQAVSLGGIPVGRLIAPAALIVILAAWIKGPWGLAVGAPLGWALAYGVWALASGFWTVDFAETLVRLGSLATAGIYMLAFGFLLRSRSDLDRVLYTMTLVALAVGLFGVGATLLAGSGPLAGTLDAQRAEGASGDPNFFATVQTATFPLVLALATTVTRRWVRLGLYAVVVVILVSVLLSLSRGGVLTLAAVALLTLVLPVRTLFRSRQQKALVLLVVLVGAAFAYKATSDQLAQRFRDDPTGSGRVNVWLGARTGIEERPILGVGYGGFAPASNELMLRTPGVDLSESRLRPEGINPHSAYLGTAVELGLPGLMLFLGLLVSTGRSLWRSAARAHAAGDWYLTRVAYALLVSLAAWALASVFLTTETARPLWILVGMAIALPSLAARAPERRTPRPGEDGGAPTRRPAGGSADWWRVGEIERLVEEHAQEFPHRAGEWRAEVAKLRSLAGPNGLLPRPLDVRVRDVFGELGDRLLSARGS